MPGRGAFKKLPLTFSRSLDTCSGKGPGFLCVVVIVLNEIIVFCDSVFR